MQYDLTIIGIILAIIGILSPILIKSYKILKIKYGFGLTYNIFGFENQKNEPKLSIEVERALPESKKINILTFRGISDFAVSDSTLPKQFESNINSSSETMKFRAHITSLNILVDYL